MGEGESVRIGVIGDHQPSNPTHRATDEALGHSGTTLGVEVEVEWLPTETLECSTGKLGDFDGLWCAPGSPYASLEGALAAIRFARENDRPLIGTCGGFQHIVLEYARNVLGFEDASHAEYDPYASALFITPLSCSLAGQTMQVEVRDGTLAAHSYRRSGAVESYYCNFGLNPEYKDALFSGELEVSGVDSDGEERIIELKEIDRRRFFLATLFVPQIASKPGEPHPLVTGFVRAARKFAAERTEESATSFQGSVSTSDG